MSNSAIRKLAAVAALLAPLPVFAQPVISSPFMFTENRGASFAFASSYDFVMGATSITPSGSGTTAFATHLPAGSGPDYTLNFVTGQQFPNQYAVRTAYTGQTGRWQISATDAGGTSSVFTHVLDDVRVIPLLTGVTLSGPALAPHISWNAVDTSLFPSFCFAPCQTGFDFFSYQVEVREVTGTPGNAVPLAFTSAGINTQTFISGVGIVPTATGFDIPVGILQEGHTYVFGVRLNQNELEVINPNGTFQVFTENRSTAYASAAPIPEPETYGMLLAGLGLLVLARRRKRKPPVG